MKFLIFLIFFYSKYNLLFAKSNKNKTVIEADNIISESKNSKISASGNVIFIRDKYKITADKVIYDKNKKKIYLEKRAKFIDTENNKIIADKAELSDDVKTGKFNNASIILNNGLSIVSPLVEKIDDNNYESTNSDYYFCPNDNLDMNLNYEDIVKEIKKGGDNLQIFSIYSKETTINKNEGKMYLKHVFLKFFDVPIFYLPYIITERPFNNRISGFSAPYILKNNNYGYAISIPIDLYLFDNIDINTETNIYQNFNFLIDSNFKYRTKNFFINIRLDYVFDNNQSETMKNTRKVSEKDEGVYRNNRLYGDINSRVTISENLFFRTRIRFSTDPYIIRDYFNDYSETLRSDANLFKINKKDNINFDIVAFQHIREKRQNYIRETPNFIPAIYYSYINDNLPSYLDFTINSGAVLSYSDFGKKYDKMFFKPTLGFKNIFGKLFIKSNLSLYNDVYNQSYNNKENNFKYRIYPEIEFKTTYILPIFKTFLIKPIAQVFLGNSKNMNFVDIDSKNSELTINNLFTNNRYSGYDLIENGTRINYGIIGEIPYEYGKFKIIVGQGYKNNISKEYKISFFQYNFSDILSGLSFNYKNIFNIDYLKNNDNLTYRKNSEEFIISGAFYKFYYNVGYVFVENYNSKIRNKQKQVHFAITYNITKKFKMRANINNDIINKKIVYYGGGLYYEDNCYLMGFEISKQSFVNSYNEDNFMINFNFKLRGIKI